MSSAAATNKEKKVFMLIAKSAYEGFQADASGEYKPPTFDEDGGFIHLTGDEDLLLPVANNFLRGIPEPVMCLVIDQALATSPVVWEGPASVGTTESPEALEDNLFPHMYGPLNISAVVDSWLCDRAEDGQFLSCSKPQSQ